MLNNLLFCSCNTNSNTNTNLNLDLQNTIKQVESTTKKRLSLYDNISNSLDENDHQEFKSLVQRNISVDNIKILHYLKSKEDNSNFFIDSGSYGQVFLAHKLTNELLDNYNSNKSILNTLFNKKKHARHNILSISKLGVIKQFSLEDNTQEELENTIYNAKEEIKYTKAMGIPTKLFIDSNNRDIKIIYDYKGNSLDHYIQPKKSQQPEKLSEPDNTNCHDLNRLIAKQVMQQVIEFHQKTNSIHGDIKGSNIVVNQAAEAFLIDFGVATPMNKHGYLYTDDLYCSRLYLSPECFYQQYINGKKFDAWCIGLTFLHVIMQKCIFFVQEAQLNKYYFDNKIYEIKMKEFRQLTSIPNDIKSAITGLLHKDPKKRLSIEDALSLINKNLLKLNNVELEFKRHKSIKNLLNIDTDNKRISRGNIPHESPILEFID